MLLIKAQKSTYIGYNDTYLRLNTTLEDVIIKCTLNDPDMRSQTFVILEILSIIRGGFCV